uniref:Uncharacterized protein n=1 Tax=Rhizophora mucronata TaxID=61149 RepID=A0A2P2N5E1_RHIMU
MPRNLTSTCYCKVQYYII